MYRTFQGSHLLSFYIFRSMDRLQIIRYMTEAVFSVYEAFDVDVFESVEQTLAEGAVKNRICFLCIFKQVRQIQNHEILVKSGDACECGNGHLDISELH